MLGLEPGSSRRATNALNCWVISPPPRIVFYKANQKKEKTKKKEKGEKIVFKISTLIKIFKQNQLNL